MIYGYIYKITHIPSKRYYIGQRKNSKPEKDNYSGSGKAWTKIFNAHPKEEFIKEILTTADSGEELNELEKEYIGDLFKRDELCMNLTAGGKQKFGEDNYFFNKHFTKELNPFYGKKHSEETRKIISEKAKGRKHSEEAKRKMSIASKGKPKSETMKRRLSEARKGKCWISLEGRKRIGEANHNRIIKEQTREKWTKQRKGRKWFNNGKQECLVFTCPSGFSSGRLKR